MTARYWPCYRCSHGGKLFTEFPGIRYCTVPGYAAGSPSWHWRLLFSKGETDQECPSFTPIVVELAAL